MSFLDGFYTVSELVKRNPHLLTVGGVRYYLARRYSNGLAESGAIQHPRKKLLIHEPTFFKWYFSGQTDGNHSSSTSLPIQQKREK